MSARYTVVFSGVSITLQQDLFSIVAAAGKVAKIIAVCISQTSDYKDAEEEGLLILIKSGQTTVGSGGGTYTPVGTNPATDPAAGFTARINDTTIASAGTIVTHHADAWNVRMPFWWIPPEKMVVELTGGRRGTVNLASTPGDAITANGTLYVEEVG